MICHYPIDGGSILPGLQECSNQPKILLDQCDCVTNRLLTIIRLLNGMIDMRTPDSLASRVSSLLSGYGLLAIGGFLFFYSGAASAIPEWAGLLLVVGLIALLEIAEYPITTVGTRRSVDVDPVREDEQVCCDTCGSRIDDGDGEHRRYAKRQIAFGIPLRTLDWGLNTYCTACESPVSPKATSAVVRGVPEPDSRGDHGSSVERRERTYEGEQH